MGEDSDPDTGSNAADPRDDESDRPGDRAPDADRDTDRRSDASDGDGATDADAPDADGDAADADAPPSPDADPDGDGTETTTDADDTTVAQVDLDGGDSDETSDPATEGDADTGDGAPGGDPTSDDGVESDDDVDTIPDDTIEADDDVGPVPDDTIEADEFADDGDNDGDGVTAVADPVAVDEAVPDPGGPDDAPMPDPDAEDGTTDPVAPDAPSTDDGAGGHGAFPSGDATGMPAETEAETETDAADAAGMPAAETGSETDLTPVDDTADYGGPELDDDPGEFDGMVGEGPAEDEEMPLADHIEEMIHRLGIVFLIGGVVLIAAFPTADRIVNFLWNAHIPGAAAPTSPRRPRLYGPLELILTELKVAGLAGFVAGLPALVYQSYRFMRPGLYPKERRYYLASVPTSLVLALVGVAFAHFIVLPAIFAYFTSYTVNAEIVVAFGLRETFNLILLLMGYMALVFQIPLFMMLAIMMGLVTRRWMTQKRLLFWGAFLGVSFLISPDPTGMTPIIVAATMISLFEGTLLLIKWTTER